MDLFGSGAHWPLHRLVRCLGRGVLLEGRSIWRSRGFSHLRSASPACGAPRFHRATPTSPRSKDDGRRLSHTRHPAIGNRHGRGQCPSADAWWCHRWRLLGVSLRDPFISRRCYFEMRSSAGPRGLLPARIYTWGLQRRPTPKRCREALRLPLSGWITPKLGAETPFAGAQSRLSPSTLPTPDTSRPSKLGRLRGSTPRGSNAAPPPLQVGVTHTCRDQAFFRSSRPCATGSHSLSTNRFQSQPLCCAEPRHTLDRTWSSAHAE